MSLTLPLIFKTKTMPGHQCSTISTIATHCIKGSCGYNSTHLLSKSGVFFVNYNDTSDFGPMR